jgi:hypothetical protein
MTYGHAAKRIEGCFRKAEWIMHNASDIMRGGIDIDIIKSLTGSYIFDV